MYSCIRTFTEDSRLSLAHTTGAVDLHTLASSHPGVPPPQNAVRGNDLGSRGASAATKGLPTVSSCSADKTAALWRHPPAHTHTTYVHQNRIVREGLATSDDRAFAADRFLGFDLVDDR